MSKYKEIEHAEAKIRKLEQKQRNLQANFDAQAHGHRNRVWQYEAQIDRLEKEIARPGPSLTPKKAWELHNAPNLEAFTEGLKRIGVVVKPAPKPTNAEKIADKLAVIANMPGWERKLIADELDKAGVKAQGGE